jgi:hypothetical protein
MLAIKQFMEISMSQKIKLNLDSLKTRREWKRHRVKDGHNVFRILPPFGENSNGYPYRKWQVIWGLKNPEDGRMRPYASSMTSEKACPVTEYVAELKTKSDTLRAKLQAAGTSEEEIKERVGNLNKLISDLSPKTVYVYNAVDKAGEVGLLELKSTAHKKMKAEMLDYVRIYNQDPTSLGSSEEDSGVWFDVIRSGLGRDTEYDVKKCQTRVKDERGKVSFEDDRSALPDNVVDSYNDLAYDLSSVYQVRSYSDLEQILAANMADIVASVPDADTSATVAPVVQKTTPPVVKPTSKVTLKLDDVDEEDEEDVPMRRVAPSVTKAVAAVKTVNAHDDDDFIKQMEAQLLGK